MKPTGGSLVIALAAALIFVGYSAFAQVPTSQIKANDDGVGSEAKPAASREPGIDLKDRLELRKSGSTTETVGFFDANFLGRSMRSDSFQLRYVTSSQPQSVGRASGNGPYEGQESPASLAKKVLNPVSTLGRISFENDFDFGMSANREGYRYTMMIEPVIPIRLGADWNLILRTRMPWSQQDGIEESMMQTGLGDTIQSALLSPNDAGPFFWGAGGALLIPTATDRLLGTGKFGLGPTIVIGQQQGGWTYGVLGRHIWSVAGHADRPDVSATFIQPFAGYTTRSGWSIALNTESTYDWMTHEWAAPLHFELTKVIYVGHHPVSVGGAMRCWVATHTGGPQACGFRLTVTPLFPAR